MKEPVLTCCSRNLNLLLFPMQHLSWRPTMYITPRIFMLEGFFLLLTFVVSWYFSSLVLGTALDIGGIFLYIESTRQLKAFRDKIHKTDYLLLIVLGHFQKILIIYPWASLGYSLVNYTDFCALTYLSFLPKHYLA